MTVMTASTTSASSTFSGCGSIKKKIRDTTRLLNRPNLPADLRREQERKLAALQVALTDRSQAEVEREMSVKYRMVKFFERKKALRRLASAQAKNDSSSVAAAQLDLAYVLHFPKDRKYISLYAASNTEGEAVVAERESIRRQISEKLALLGAEVMLAKVTKKALKESDEDDEEDEDSEDEDVSDNEDDEEDSDNEDDQDSDDNSGDDSDDILNSSDDSNELLSATDSDSEDTDDTDDDDLDSGLDSDDSDDSAISDSDNELSYDEDSDSDEDGDSDSDDDDDDDDGDSDDESEESESESESDDEDAPKPKKNRRH